MHPLVWGRAEVLEEDVVSGRVVRLIGKSWIPALDRVEGRLCVGMTRTAEGKAVPDPHHSSIP